MITLEHAWAVLGLEPTLDPGLIQRAYAARLRMLDPDRDIAAFAELREALDMARRHAEASPSPLPEADAAAYDDDTGDGGWTVHRDDGPAEIAQSDEAEDARARVRVNTLLSLLHDRADTPYYRHKLIAAFDALFLDPRLEQVGFREGFENWLAELLLGNSPASDMLMQRAIDRLDWAQELAIASPRWRVVQVVRKARDVEARGIFSQPAHAWHDAWQLLKRPREMPVTRVERVKHQRQVNELLASIRYHYPTLEWELDRHTVEQWASGPRRLPDTLLFRKAGISWYGWLVLGFVVYQLSRAIFGGLA